MTLVELAPLTSTSTYSPFSVVDGQVGHWSLLLDGSSSPGDPELSPPSPGWAGSPMTTIETPDRKTWIFGELYGPDREHLKTRMLENRRGTLFEASRINGHCVILSIDHANRGRPIYTLWTNRFGSVHVYLVRTPHHTLLTSCYPNATRFSARQLDWPALGRYTLQGFFPTDRTHFEDIRVLAPCRQYEFDRHGRQLSEDKYWSWPTAPDFEGSYDEALDELSFLAQTVCTELCSEGTVAVPISGGLDSRSTLSVLPDSIWQAGRALAFSYGYTEDSVEITIARKLAACRSLPFESYVIEPYLFDHLSHLYASTGGLQDLTQPRQQAVVEQLATRCNRILAAHWGDVWLDNPIDEGEGAEQLPLERITLSKLLKPGRDRLRACLDPKVENYSVEAMESDLRTELLDYDSILDRNLRLKAWKTDNWSHRWTLSSLRVYQTCLFPRLVFYDTRMADFLMSLPSSFLADRRLQIDLIKRRSPDLARVRWQEYDANLYLAPFHDSLLLPVRALRRLKRAWWPAPVPLRNWEIQLQGDDNHHRLEANLDQRSAIYPFLRPDRVRKLLEELRTRPDREVGYAACQLLTLATVFQEAGV